MSSVFKVLFIIPFLNYISLNSHSQDKPFDLKGYVFTTDSIPISSSIKLLQQKKQTISNSSGYFLLKKILPIQDTLEISYLGKLMKKVPLQLDQNHSSSFENIYLNYSHILLDSVFIRYDAYKNNNLQLINSATRSSNRIQDLPQAISIINADNIKERMQLSIKDVMPEFAGINHYSGYDEYTIRGLKAENAKMINGLRGFNSTYTSNLLTNVERVEFIKGPIGALYGNGDPGGTVNLITKAPLDYAKNEITLLTGSWNHQRILGDFTAPVNKSKTLLYRLNFAYDKTASYRNQLNSNIYQVAPSLSFKPNKKLSITSDLSFTNTNSVLDRGQPGLYNSNDVTATSYKLNVSQPGDYLKEKTFFATSWIHYQFSKNFSTHLGILSYTTDQDAQGHGIHSYINRDSVNLYFTKWDYKSHTENITQYFQYLYTKGNTSHQLTGGFDFIKTKAEPEQLYFDNPLSYAIDGGIVGGFNIINPNYASRSTETYIKSGFYTDVAKIEPAVFLTKGIYLQDHIKWNKLSVVLGMRQEFYESEDENAAGEEEETLLDVFLPKIAIMYKLNGQNNLFALYSKGFDPFEASSSTQIFKETFKPVNSQIVELGLKSTFFENKLSASHSIYKIKLQNVAVNAKDITNPNLFVQRGEHSSYGFESEWNGHPYPNVYFNFNYAYNISKITKSVIESEIGNFVENAPVSSSSSWFKYQFERGLLNHFGIVFGHLQASKRYLVSHEIILPGYITFQSGLRYDKNNWNIALNINNVFNKIYWIGGYTMVNKWPGAPRNYSIQFSFKL